MKRSQQHSGDEFEVPPEFAPRRAVVRILSEVTPRKIEWLWPQRIAIGKLCILAGRPGLGKSLLTTDLAARISTGTPFPDCRDVVNPPGDVVMLNCEDDIEDTVVPRLMTAEADLARIRSLDAIEANFATGNGAADTYQKAFSLDKDIRQLEDVLDACPNPRMVTIDPVTAYIGDSDSHRDANVRALLGPLSELAGRRRVAVVLVMHLNKSSASGQTALERVGGSIAFMGAARLAHLIERDSRAEADPRTRLFIPLKSNITPETLGLAYTIEGDSEGVPKLLWSPDPVALSADDAMRPTVNKVGEKTKEAATWLREQLADGAIYSDDLDERRKAVDIDISYHAFKAAKKLLGVKSRKASFDGRWVVYLPENENLDSDAPSQSDDLLLTHKQSTDSNNDRPNGDSKRPIRLGRSKTQSVDLVDRFETSTGPTSWEEPPLNEALADAIGAAGDEQDGIPF